MIQDGELSTDHKILVSEDQTCTQNVLHTEAVSDPHADIVHEQLGNYSDNIMLRRG